MKVTKAEKNKMKKKTQRQVTFLFLYEQTVHLRFLNK